jgi:putative membrane protein
MNSSAGRAVLALIIAASAVSSVATAQDTRGTSPSASAATRSNASDPQQKGANLTSKEFVTRAAQGNLAEIEVSQLALKNTQNAEVRRFAQRMIDDHTKANAQLQPLAEAKGIKVPDETDALHKVTMKLLQARDGAEFDKSYIEQMDKDHQKTIALFESASVSTKVDKEFQSLASTLLPTLHQHHEQVAQLASGTGAATANP